jgi:hypothetical protein
LEVMTWISHVYSALKTVNRIAHSQGCQILKKVFSKTVVESFEPFIVKQVNESTSGAKQV